MNIYGNVSAIALSRLWNLKNIIYVKFSKEGILIHEASGFGGGRRMCSWNPGWVATSWKCAFLSPERWDRTFSAGSGKRRASRRSIRIRQVNFVVSMIEYCSLYNHEIYAKYDRITRTSEHQTIPCEKMKRKCKITFFRPRLSFREN